MSDSVHPSAQITRKLGYIRKICLNEPFPESGVVATLKEMKEDKKGITT